jgi:plastocyanin
MKLLRTAVVLAFATGSAVGALAGQRAVTQKGKAFSETQVTIKTGDTIVFVNDDNVSHNILSTTPGNEFNLGSQPPGSSTPVTFTTQGQVNVMCAIHPLMKMQVNVTD